ncbi:hypothetical protein AX15_004632 [Amanita polypyramis BW_CC]|nr:hypothetical protein AX15_004632 [Amanita polypyramis BW_CC]
MLAVVFPSAAAAKPRPRLRRPPTPDAAPGPSAHRPRPIPAHASHAPSATLDIDSYPPQKLLKLLASLLTQIAATNDALSPASAVLPPISSPSTPLDNQIWHSLTTASRAALSTPSATLAFHARNIPTISLEAYLLRILKYCPTTNQVFLSLLVYFDRMSKLTADATTRTFVIDSYNIHRLVIAGVTVASKFFSDVFYTNSRYAKVGGLPLTELNQLELQFLLLNDFRLVISSTEMQRYAEQLILFSQSHTDYVSPMSLSIPSTSTLDHTPISPVSHNGPGALPSPSPAISSSTHHQLHPDPSQAHDMHTMGAIDAYGGRIPGEVPKGCAMTRDHQPHTNGPSSSADFSAASTNSVNRTPNARLVRRDSVSTSDDTETETENETGTETGTETDADDTSTTDDEPTIRPGRTSIAGSVYSVTSASSAGSGSSGGRAGSGESAANGHGARKSRNDKESDVCSVRSFDTGDEAGDEYENDGEIDEDVVPSSSSGGMDIIIDDGERTPETNAESARGVKRHRIDKGEPNGSKSRRASDGHMSTDRDGDTRMRSPRP